MDEPNETPPRVITIPSDRTWIDPRLVSANLYTKTTTVPVDPAAPTIVAKTDVNRWALGFLTAPGGGNGVYFAPYPDLVTGTGFALAAEGIQWFRLTEYGPVVNLDWWAIGGAGGIIRLIEVLRR